MWSKNGSAIAALLATLIFSAAQTRADESGAALLEPSLEYEISEGQITLFLFNASPADVERISWADQDLPGVQWEKSLPFPNGNGFSIQLKAGDLNLEESPVVRVEMMNGERLEKALLSGPPPSMEWLSAEKATCKEAAGIYNAVQCGSTKSGVGTPPYPCCDNNGDRNATGSGDGNCTWYAWYRAKADKKWTVPSTWSSGSRWCANAAKTSGWKVSSIPTRDTIACSSTIGHVGWVTDVSTDKKTITLAEQNCKVPPSCFGSGTRSRAGYNAASFQYISCTDSSKCR